MWECFFPDSRAVSAYEIAYETYYEKGYRGIIFDIDNTLVEHGRDATKRAVELFEKLHEIGFATALLSNNKKERVDRFNKEIGTHVVWKAGKPGKKGYLLAMEKMHTTRETTLFVGDQLFTDVWGAKSDGSIDAGHLAAKAIMTTDTVPKEVAVTFEIGGKKVLCIWI